MKNICATLLVLSALVLNTVADNNYKPHKMFNKIHPLVFKMYMESLADSVPEMEDMLTLFNIYWGYIKTGICEYERVMYCYCLNKAHNVLMDLYFSDQETIDAAELFLVEKQNDMFPLEAIDELQWADEAIFTVQSTTPPEDLDDVEYWTEPYEMIKDIVPQALMEYMESQSNMEELLTLYKFYWKYKESDRCVDELARFCDLLLDGFSFLFNFYFDGSENNIEAEIPSMSEIQERLNLDSQHDTDIDVN